MSTSEALKLKEELQLFGRQGYVTRRTLLKGKRVALLLRDQAPEFTNHHESIRWGPCTGGVGWGGGKMGGSKFAGLLIWCVLGRLQVH